MVFQAYVRAVSAPQERRPRLETARRAQGHTWRLSPVVQALQARRGLQCTVAVTRMAARGDLTRCEQPRPLMSSLGLPPSADSRGARRRQGRITTAGHTVARRALIAGAGADRSPAQVSRHRPGAWRRDPRPSSIAGGKPRCAGARVADLSPHGGNRPPRGWSRSPGTWPRCIGAIAREVPMTRDNSGSSPRSAPGASRHPQTIGREAAAVGRQPRRRDAAARNPRASIEAGARRTPVRWDPTHGYQPDQPS